MFYLSNCGHSDISIALCQSSPCKEPGKYFILCALEINEHPSDLALTVSES